MALLAEMHYNFITLVYIVSKYITNTTICVCRYSLELKALSSGSLFLKTNHRYYQQIQGQLYINGHSQCDLVVWSTVNYCRSASHSHDYGHLVDLKYLQID